jgi:RNA polymerase sigma factor (sigma-70 family)
MLHRLGARRYGRADLDDLVQDALEYALRHEPLRRFDPALALHWAARTAWTAWHRKHRPGIGTDRGRAPLSEHQAAGSATAEQLLVDRELHEAFAAAVGELPAGQRQVINLYGEGRTVHEQSVELGIALGTVDSRRQRALYRLREVLADFGPPAAAA